MVVTRRPARLLLWVLFLLVAAALAGCGGRGDGNTSSIGTSASAVVPPGPPGSSSADESGEETREGESEFTRSPPLPDMPGGVPQPAPQPAPEPQPAPIPQPAPEPEPTPEPEPPPEPEEPDLESFVAQCEGDVRDWRAGQVSYPEEVRVEVGETKAYVATVDVRPDPADPSDVIPGPFATGEEVSVRCEIAARLTSLGGALTVDEDDWVLRSFTPSGVIRWTWAVTAVKAAEQDLRLELQPAVRSEDGAVLVSDTSTDVSSFVTRARVEQGALQRMGDWWTENWGTITLVSAGIGAAVLALLRYGTEFAGQFRRVVAAWQGEPGRDQPAEGEDADEPPRDAPG
jgi:hypothetical protein